MAEQTTTLVDPPKDQAKAERQGRRLPGWVVSLTILALAGVIFLLVFGNWDRWQSNQSEQRTDDAYVRADVASLSTKASGIVLTMAVEEYQRVKAGQVIATLKADDYQTQVEAAQAALDGSIAEVGELTKQKRIADTKIQQAVVAINASRQQAAAAQAAVIAAQAAATAAQAGIAAAQAQLKNAREERERQEGLFSNQVTTLQALQNQRARSDEAQAQADSQQSQFASAQAQVALRKADRTRRSRCRKQRIGSGSGTECPKAVGRERQGTAVRDSRQTGSPQCSQDQLGIHDHYGSRKRLHRGAQRSSWPNGWAGDDGGDPSTRCAMDHRQFQRDAGQPDGGRQ